MSDGTFNRELAEDLNRIAFWLTKNAEVLPEMTQFNTLSQCLSGKAEITACAHVLHKLTGRTTKDIDKADDGYYRLRVVGLKRMSLYIFAVKARVCRRVKVGTRIIPDQPEKVTPAIPEHEEPIYEWTCDEPILAVAKEAATDA